jgi:hypothetical protein
MSYVHNDIHYFFFKKSREETTDLFGGDMFRLGKVFVKDTALRGALEAECTIIRLGGSQAL